MINNTIIGDNFLSDGMREFCMTIMVLIVTLCFHSIYVALTNKKDQIVTVQSKSIFTKKSNSACTILDSKTNTCMRVDNCIYMWEWNAAEEFMNLKEGETYMVNLYGIRLPPLGLYPVIYKIKKKTN